MLRIVMDGAGDLPPSWVQEYAIDVIPVNIHFKDQVFLQGVNLSDAEFYRLADQSSDVPKTSQPTPRQFVDFYKRIAQPGDQILSIHITSKLSGTYDSAVMAAQELEGQYDIRPLDSRTGSAAMGLMCREARLMERAGSTLDAILERMAVVSQEVSIILTLDTLEYARKSGRVKALQAALASVLNVKPIAVLSEGVLVMADRVRTRQKALDTVLEMLYKKVGNQKVKIAIVQARDPQAGQALLERARLKFNCQESLMTDLSISVAANLGPGTVGIVAYPVEE